MILLGLRMNGFVVCSFVIRLLVMIVVMMVCFWNIPISLIDAAGFYGASV